MSSSAPNVDPNLEPNGENRILAAVSHWALFGGCFVVGPLAIYFIKREQSRFVAFHAAQAAIVSLLAIALAGAAWVVLLPLLFIGFGIGAAAHSEGVAIAGAGVFYLLALGISVLPLILAVVAGWRAFQGKWWVMPIVGNIAARIIQGDPKVAR